jgi:DDE superfamily endonuclease
MTGTVANATRPDQRVLFQAHIEQILAPELRLGDIVAMDNLGIHKSVAVCHAIEAAGAQPLYLPALEPVVQFVVKIALQLPSRPDSTLDIN